MVLFRRLSGNPDVIKFSHFAHSNSLFQRKNESAERRQRKKRIFGMEVERNRVRKLSLDEWLILDSSRTVKRRRLQRMCKRLGISANGTVLSF
jgi:hypothetical protein